MRGMLESNIGAYKADTSTVDPKIRCASVKIAEQSRTKVGRNYIIEAATGGGMIAAFQKKIYTIMRGVTELNLQMS